MNAPAVTAVVVFSLVLVAVGVLLTIVVFFASRGSVNRTSGETGSGGLEVPIVVRVT